MNLYFNFKFLTKLEFVYYKFEFLSNVDFYNLSTFKFEKSSQSKLKII